MKLPDLSILAGDAAAAGALAHLDARQWRKARDVAKELCRKDRERYLPLLIAANAGLAQELLERGLTQDAGPVIAYLKTIAPPEFVAALESRKTENTMVAALQKGRPDQATEAIQKLLQAAIRTTDEGGPISAGAVQAADQLVCGTLPLPAATKEAEASLAKELALVQEAVDATGDGRWDAAQETLRGLPRRSLFQHWRLFLRGIRCAHLGDAVTARQCFDALPPGSATARASAPWRELCGLSATAEPAPRDASIVLLTALCGAPASWAAPLAAADAHWRRLRPVAAFDALRNGLRDAFPDDRPGLPGLLTDLMLGGKLHASGSGRDGLNDYFEHLFRLVLNKQCRSEREQKAIRRMLCLNDGGGMEPGALEQHFLEIVRIDRKLHGADPLRESAAWTFAAELAMTGQTDMDLTACDWTPRERGIIRLMHQKAAELDPANPVPAMALLGFYEAAGELAAAKKETAALAKNFPDNKEMLLRFASAAVSRKAFAGALKSLRRAREIDPLDPAVRSRLASVLFESAAETAKKKPVPSALWEELEPLLVDGPAHPQSLEPGGDFAAFRWVAHAGRALLENDPARTVAAPSPVVAHFISFLLALRWRREADVKRLTSLTESAGIAVTWLDCEWIIRAAQWNESAKRSNTVTRYQIRYSMETLCRPLFRPERVVAEPRAVLDCALALDACIAGNPGGGYYSPVWNLAVSMAEALDGPANRRGADYRLRLASILFPLRDAPKGHTCFCPVLEELEKSARAAGDTGSAAVARRLVGQCGMRGVGFGMPFAFGDAGAFPDEADDPADDDDMPKPVDSAGRKRPGRRPDLSQLDLFSQLFR